MKRVFIALMVVAAMAIAPKAEAAILQIQFSGLNLVYTGDSTGGTVCDAVSCLGGGGATATADPLVTMSFIVDGNPVGTLLTDIWVDVILNVDDGIEAPLGTGAISGGIFDLLTSAAGWGLALDIGTGTITYDGDSALVSFNGTVNPSSIFTQNLPFGLILGMPVIVTFSSNTALTNATHSGGYLTALNTSGTGEVQGVTVVPEPTSMLLMGTGLLFLASRVRRRMKN